MANVDALLDHLADRGAVREARLGHCRLDDLLRSKCHPRPLIQKTLLERWILGKRETRAEGLISPDVGKGAAGMLILGE
jgi:hypothetical protein